jgi:3-hydroxyisobutyrate dehydrogenase-like beta-hydroxyacid dehydrogenase
MIEAVGIIGLGKMGLPMTGHMLKAGLKVAGYDLDAARVAEAEKRGATACSSPREVAEQSDLVIVIVGFDSEVNEVLFAENGIFAGARENAVIAVASTVYQETMLEIGEAAEKLGKGLRVLDMPLCRSERAAVDGTLLLLGGGDPKVFEECNKAFSSFASDIRVLGGLGAGQVGKMINNLLLWACISANHEGLKLGEAMGVDPEVLREALLISSGKNWALETWHLERAMPWAEKDMTIVMHEADRFRLTMPLSGVVKEVIKGVKIERGYASPKPRK